MDRKDLHDHLIDYLYGELDSETREAFDLALRDAPEVQEEIAAHERTREVFASLDEMEVPSAISEALLAEAARVAPQPREPSFTERLRRTLQLLIMHPAMSAAVVMVAVLGVSLYVYRHGAPPTARLQSNEETLSARPVVAARAPRVADKGALGAAGAVGDKASTMTEHKKKATPLEGVKQPLAARGGLRPVPSAASSEHLRGRGALKGSFAKRRSRRRRFVGGGKSDIPLNSVGRRMSARRSRKAKRSRTARLKLDDLMRKQIGKRPPAAPRGGAGWPAQSAKSAKAAETAPPKGGAAQESPAPIDWLRRGHAAVAAGRCHEALDAYTRALAKDRHALAAIRAHIGPCRSTLARSGSAHATLRARLTARGARRNAVSPKAHKTKARPKTLANQPKAHPKAQ